MSFHLAILKGKIQLCTTVCGCAVSGCAIPVFAAYSGGVGNADDVFKKISTDPLNMKERGDQLSSQYSSQLKDLKPKDFENLDKLKEQYTATETFVKSAGTLVKKYHDTANYYLFEYGDLVRGAFRWIPEIVSSSIDPSEDTGAKKLSGQKIYAIVSDNKFGDFAKKMGETFKKHSTIMNTLDDREADMILEQFKQIEKDNISPVLQKITTNADEMEQDYSACRSKFFLHLFTGKTSAETTMTTLKTLKTQLDTLKASQQNGIAESLESVGDSLDESLEKLKNLSCQTDDVQP